MSYKRLSTKVLLGIALLGLSGQQCVLAEEANTDAAQAIEGPYARAIAVSDGIRADQTALDVTVTLPERVALTRVATVELRKITGEVVSSLDYTVAKGGRQFTCWFSLNGLPADDYYTTVSLPDGPVTHYGYSKGLTYTPQSASNTSSTAQQLPSGNEKQEGVTTVTEDPSQVQQQSLEQGASDSQQEVTTATSSVPKTSETTPQSVKQASVSRKSAASLAERVPQEAGTNGFSKVIVGALIVVGLALVSALTYMIKKR